MKLQKDINSIERIQKASVNIILKNNYKDYESALKMLNLDTLCERRRKQCLKFAKDCLKHEQMKKMFPINEKNSQIPILYLLSRAFKTLDFVFQIITLRLDVYFWIPLKTKILNEFGIKVFQNMQIKIIIYHQQKDTI